MNRELKTYLENSSWRADFSLGQSWFYLCILKCFLVIKATKLCCRRLPWRIMPMGCMIFLWFYFIFFFFFFIGGKLEMSTSLATSRAVVCKNNRITIHGEGSVAPFRVCSCVSSFFSHNSNEFMSFILCPKFEWCTLTRFIFLLKELKLDGLSLFSAQNLWGKNDHWVHLLQYPDTFMSLLRCPGHFEPHRHTHRLTLGWRPHCSSVPSTPCSRSFTPLQCEHLQRSRHLNAAPAHRAGQNR